MGAHSGKGIHAIWSPPGNDRRDLIGAPGFVLLSFAHGPIQYFAAWVLLGTAGSATLTTAAYILLNEIAAGTQGARLAL